MIGRLKNNKMLLREKNSYFKAKKNYLKTTKGLKIRYQKAIKEAFITEKPIEAFQFYINDGDLMFEK
jgi:hypothetical protein